MEQILSAIDNLSKAMENPSKEMSQALESEKDLSEFKNDNLCRMSGDTAIISQMYSHETEEIQRFKQEMQEASDHEICFQYFDCSENIKNIQQIEDFTCLTNIYRFAIQKYPELFSEEEIKSVRRKCDSATKLYKTQTKLDEDLVAVVQLRRYETTLIEYIDFLQLVDPNEFRKIAESFSQKIIPYIMEKIRKDTVGHMKKPEPKNIVGLYEKIPTTLVESSRRIPVQFFDVLSKKFNEELKKFASDFSSRPASFLANVASSLEKTIAKFEVREEALFNIGKNIVIAQKSLFVDAMGSSIAAQLKNWGSGSIAEILSSYNIVAANDSDAKRAFFLETKRFWEQLRVGDSCFLPSLCAIHSEIFENRKVVERTAEGNEKLVIEHALGTSLISSSDIVLANSQASFNQCIEKYKEDFVNLAYNVIESETKKCNAMDEETNRAMKRRFYAVMEDFNREVESAVLTQSLALGWPADLPGIVLLARLRKKLKILRN